MSVSSIELVWVFVAGTIVLLIAGWAAIATIILYRQRNLAAEKEKLNAIRKSEQKYTDLFNNVSDIVYIHSLDGEIQQVNAAVTRELGYSVDEIVGKKLQEIVRPEYNPGLESYLEEIKQKGSSTGLMSLISKGQEIKIFEYRNSFVELEGKAAAVRGIARNVTEQRKTEEALRKSEERYRRFFEEDLTGDFIALPDGAIISCNPAFATIFGFESVQEALKYNLSSLYMKPGGYETYLQLIRTHRKLEYYETELRRIDGKSVFVIQNIIGLFNEAGELTQIRGYIFDNTERKQLERELLQAQKMQSIGTLAGGVAHDFNNILSIVMGHASLLEQGSMAPQGNADSIQAIHQAVKRGAHLVDQILTFARKADIVFESVDVNSVIKELVEMLSGTFPKTIVFSLSLNEQLPPIRADQNQLHQALLNLCVNARDAMPNGGTISVSTERVPAARVQKKFPEAKNTEHVWICIADTGTGIDPDTQGRLFEPFFTTKVRGQGTGLGLSVVYGIVSSHYGFIDLESELGKGTKFHFYFPKVSETLIQAKDKKDKSIPGGSETILVVEDEEMLVDLLHTIFQANGYSVLIARDGLEAIEIYREHQQEIDIIFTDSGLPKLNGWDAFRQIKKINPHAHAVFASGYFDPELKSEMMQNGVSDFIQKPYSPVRVVNRIREVLDSLKAS